MPQATLPVPVNTSPERAIVCPVRPESLTAWLQLYGAIEIGANSPNTVKAKGRDLGLFREFVREMVGSDHADQWTKSVTAGFLRHLEQVEGRKAATVNRVLATLRHAASWIHRRRPFLAGNPCEGIKELAVDEPNWRGLTDTQVMRLKSAAEQLLKLKVRKNQHPVRDFAIFLTLLHTGLRVSELVALQIEQYRGKHLHDVKRKGKVRTRQVFLPKEAREALDTYLTQRPDKTGPLFRSKSRGRVERQHVDRILKQLSAQANGRLAKEEQILFSAHVLRHTFLRKVAQRHGVQFAMDSAGHTSSKYIWRYIRPSEAAKEKALEGLF